MTRLILLFSTMFFIVQNIFAQTYTSPATGVFWNLDSLVTHSNGNVTLEASGDFHLNDKVVIALGDTLALEEEFVLLGGHGIDLTIHGALIIDAVGSVISTIDTSNNQYFKGIIIQEHGYAYINDLEYVYAGGIRVGAEDFTLTNSVLMHNKNGVTNATVSLTRGSPLIENNVFENNYTTAIASAANAIVSPQIINNTIHYNNLANSNRPQINIAGSGNSSTTDSIRIINNSIIGLSTELQTVDRVGGISITDFFGNGVLALIENNHIEDNRYGITLGGANVQAIVKDNMVLNNNIEGDPMLGGSGINLLSGDGSGNNIFLTGNHMEGNLWGITLQNDATVNLGEDSLNPGHNTFYNNGNNDTDFALYNNTPNEVWALYNCWDTAAPMDIIRAEEVIVHELDDASYGLVHFDPMWCATEDEDEDEDEDDDISISENNMDEFEIYPNPIQEYFYIQSTSLIGKVTIYNTQGQLIFEKICDSNQVEIKTASFNKGIYFLNIDSETGQQVKKLIKL